ncbi:MAG: anti-sigma factor [Terracidiphilus sp.]|jgi:anti-sigma-K factor RskA
MNAQEHISPEDLALHALGSLPEAESAAASAHLAQCAECREQLAEFSGDVAMIGLSMPQHPLPAGARQRFLDRVAADAYSSRPAPEEKKPQEEKPLPERQASQEEKTLPEVKKPAEEKKAKVVKFPLGAIVPWAIAAGLAFFAYTLNGKIATLNDQVRDESGKVTALKAETAQAERVLDVLTSPSAQRVLLTASKTAPQPSGRAIYIAETGSLLFQANNLKPIADDKTYELWVIPVNGSAIPAGLFRPDATGSASVLLPAIPAGVEAKAFGVTIEKAEGSDTPTAPIVLAGAAAAAAGE